MHRLRRMIVEARQTTEGTSEYLGHNPRVVQ
jgi:hypothetical protein